MGRKKGANETSPLPSNLMLSSSYKFLIRLSPFCSFFPPLPQFSPHVSSSSSLPLNNHFQSFQSILRRLRTRKLTTPKEQSFLLLFLHTSLHMHLFPFRLLFLSYCLSLSLCLDLSLSLSVLISLRCFPSFLPLSNLFFQF